MAGYGLDDSDFDEFLESSSDEELELPLATPLQQALPVAPQQPQHQVFLTGTSWRGPACDLSGDACRDIPSSRSDAGLSCYA